MRTMSRASGAGAYVQSGGTGERSGVRSRSVKCEVVGALVRARPLLPKLHQDVIQQRGGADAIEVGREPVDPECLVQLDEVLHRLLRLADAARRLHPDHTSGLDVNLPNRLEHAEGDGQRRRAWQL